MSTSEIQPEESVIKSGRLDDERFMSLALAQAAKAASMDEVPIGAVVVKDGQVIASACNQKETLQDPSAHAELLAIREAARKLGNWHLDECDLYVTLEPCSMCAGAMIQSRLNGVCYGTPSPKGGAVESSLRLFEQPGINHRPEVIQPVLQESCSAILKNYFAKKRKKG